MQVASYSHSASFGPSAVRVNTDSPLGSPLGRPRYDISRTCGSGTPISEQIGQTGVFEVKTQQGIACANSSTTSVPTGMTTVDAAFRSPCFAKPFVSHTSTTFLFNILIFNEFRGGGGRRSRLLLTKHRNGFRATPLGGWLSCKSRNHESRSSSHCVANSLVPQFLRVAGRRPLASAPGHPCALLGV